MISNFENLVVALTTQIFSDDNFCDITNILQEIKYEDLSKFILSNLNSLQTLEHWAWNMLSESRYQWINQPNYLEFFKSLAVFNTNLIFISNDIDADTKGSLLIPKTTDISKKIFEQIEQIDNENDLYFLLITLWYDNLSYLCQEHVKFIKSPIIIDINHMIVTKFVMTDQYKSYLTQLQQPTLIYTNKQMFFLKTCSFSLSSFLFCKKQVFPFISEDILHFLAKDYLEIIRIHSPNIQNWSKELLCSITHLINFIHTCCWWRGDTQAHINILLPTEDISHHHVKSLIHIIGFTPFHQYIEPHRFNDETILIDSIAAFVKWIIEFQSLTCFVRHRTHLIEILLPLAETPRNNLINLRAYALLGDILCDEYLKKLKIANHVNDYFFHVLKIAWNDPGQMYQRVCVEGLLRNLLNLAKNDSVQQAIAESNNVTMLLEMCEQYPVVYDVLWALSFNPNIQEQLRSNPKFMYNISHLKQELNNEQMRKITHGILWNLEQNHEEHTVTDNNNNNNETMFDIMISYSHKDKVLCKKIYDELIKAHYRVWIDFDQMHGNVMDAMAQAIEHSRMVVICMSEHYRRSNYCRAEAYYAFQRQLKIVPVLLQEHYKPDGWLLFLVGQLLYVDFTKHEFSQATKMLFKELKDCPVEEKKGIVRSESRHEMETIASSLPIPLPIPGLVSEFRGKNMIHWSQEEVQEWLIGHNLTQMSRLLSDHDGTSLIYLNRYLANGEAGQVIKLLGDDSIRRIHQNLSLLELSRLQTLIDKEAKEHPNSKSTEKSSRHKKNIFFKSCNVM